ncbi:MAG: hypothetical protein ABI478_08070 [Propionivibrio sp.]
MRCGIIACVRTILLACRKLPGPGAATIVSPPIVAADAAGGDTPTAVVFCLATPLGIFAAIEFMERRTSWSTLFRPCSRLSLQPPIDYGGRSLRRHAGRRRVLSTSVGASNTYMRLADRIIIEPNAKHPVWLLGMHDIFEPQDPPARHEIPIFTASDRVGSPICIVIAGSGDASAVHASW